MILYSKNMPELDLHGEDRVGAGIKINKFIEENIILKNRYEKTLSVDHCSRYAVKSFR